MDTLAHDSFITGAEWAIALGFFSALAAWGFHVFARLFERAVT